jgi:hypothetical protein
MDSKAQFVDGHNNNTIVHTEHKIVSATLLSDESNKKGNALKLNLYVYMNQKKVQYKRKI